MLCGWGRNINKPLFFAGDNYAYRSATPRCLIKIIFVLEATHNPSLRFGIVLKPMNVLIILGHPDAQSLCHALAEAYRKGARETGAHVTLLELGKLHFDPILHKGYREVQELEPDLLRAQQLIKEANHIVVIYPSWWGAMPALLKGFFDRVLVPGFAFKYREKSPFWDKYLKGKTARIIITMDAPSLWNRIMYHRANIFAVKVATLQYCGIKPVRVTTFDNVRMSVPERRAKWLQQARELGQRLK